MPSIYSHLSLAWEMAHKLNKSLLGAGYLSYFDRTLQYELDIKASSRQKATEAPISAIRGYLVKDL